MFNKLRKLLAKENGIKIPEYQQIFNNVIGYNEIKLLLYKMITSKYTNSFINRTTGIFKDYIHIRTIRSFQR